MLTVAVVVILIYYPLQYYLRCYITGEKDTRALLDGRKGYGIENESWERMALERWGRMAGRRFSSVPFLLFSIL